MKNVFKLIIMILGGIIATVACSTVFVLIITGFCSLVCRTLPNPIVFLIAVGIITVVLDVILAISMIVTNKRIKKQLEETRKKGEELLKKEAEGYK